MKTALKILSALTLVGCSGENPFRLPTYPDPPPDQPPNLPSAQVSLWGMVVNEFGGCIEATVTVVRGQSLGQTIAQTTPCDMWGYGGGFVFKNLTEGVEMTLRSSATGYTPVEKTVVPHGGAQTAVILVSSPIR